MKVDIFIRSKAKGYFANAVYTGEEVIVKNGGRISDSFAEYIRGGKTAKFFRENEDYVDKEGNILKDCKFKSLSTAAQFVSGRSLDGFNAWKVEEKKNIGKYLEEKGLRKK